MGNLIFTDMMANLTSLGWFAFAILCFNLTPGADSLLLVRTSIKQGIKAGLGVVAGIVVSSCAWGLLTIIGLSAVISKSPVGFTVLKWGGGLYLIYLGLSTLYASFKSQAIDLDLKEDEKKGVIAGIRSGFITDFFNPTVGVFNLTFFPQFIPQHTSSVTQYLVLLVLVYVATTLVSYSTMVYLSNLTRRAFTKPIVLKVMDWVSAALFIYFGIKLLLIADL